MSWLCAGNWPLYLRDTLRCESILFRGIFALMRQIPLGLSIRAGFGYHLSDKSETKNLINIVT